MKAIIVGVDPGTYVGIAIFDVNMNLISSSTIIDKGKEAVVAEITKHGHPIVVASDVSPPPSFVTQIASYFNARIYSPRSTISDFEKTKDTSRYKFGSVHERDAIIAVLSFFKESSNKLRWIEKTLRDKGLINIEEDVKRYALSGMRVDDAIKALVPADEEYNKVIEYARSLPEAPSFAKMAERREEDRGTIIGLLESNIRLRSRVSILEEENRELKMRSGAQIDSDVRNIIFSKEMKIRRLKKIIDLKDKTIQNLKRLLFSKEKGSFIQKTQSQSQKAFEAKGKDLKEKDVILSIENIVNEYRETRFQD